MATCGVCGEKFDCEHVGWKPGKGNFFIHHVPSEDPNIREIQHITYFKILQDGFGTFVQQGSVTFIGYIKKALVQKSIFDFTKE